MSKDVGSCGRFPFCENSKGPEYYCIEWIKDIREIEYKLENKENDLFEFKKIGD